jgi:hypothetical protein
MNDSWSSRALPDPEISLRDARDFIVGSPLARKAFACSEHSLPLFLHDLLDAIYRLVQSCHLPEFTDHGLPHLCSLVDRISRWELPPNPNEEQSKLTDKLSPEEAATLLVATLIHDIGMLSQNPIDLPDDATHLQSKANWSDVATWVRSTHVDRLKQLTVRVLEPYGHDEFLTSDLFLCAVEVAMAHQKWPWEWTGTWSEDPRFRGLAAVVAVSDLLDEDSARCDTTTLLEHREGNELNRAHWLRHALTTNRILVEGGQIRVQMEKPPDTTEVLKPVYSALRNHFRLVSLYEDDLKAVHAPITNIELHPSTGVPTSAATGLKGWEKIRGFSNEQALCFQLLRTFLHLVLKDERRCAPDTLDKIRYASLEDVDLRVLEACEGTAEPRTEFEKTFAAIALADEAQ